MNNMYVFGTASVAFLEAPNTFNWESQHPIDITQWQVF